MNRSLLILVILMLAPVIASATTSVELLSDCKDALLYIEKKDRKNTNPVSAGFCMGLVDGVINTVIDIGKEVSSNKYCRPPPNVTLQQSMRIFVKWAEENPDKLHLKASYGVITSHLEAFCK